MYKVINFNRYRGNKDTGIPLFYARWCSGMAEDWKSEMMNGSRVTGALGGIDLRFCIPPLLATG